MSQTYGHGTCGCGGPRTGCGFGAYRHERGKRHIAWLRTLADTSGDKYILSQADKLAAQAQDDARRRRERRAALALQEKRGRR